jgi:Uma2 family endonuclease
MVEAGVVREDEHVELLDGELIEMPPQGPHHSDVATDLHEALLRAYGPEFVVRESKPLVAGLDQLPEPDVSVLRRADRARGIKHPRAADTVLIVEIAKTSLAIDRDKARVYATAGAPTYWIVDLVACHVEVHEDPQADGRYRNVRVLAGDDTVQLPQTNVAWRAADVIG